MADFEVKTYAIDVRPHPDPEVERLECAMVGDFAVVVGKRDYVTGDVVAYIPEASVLPPDLIAEMGLEGRLSGADKNRVKAIRLRGQLSQGLVHRVPGVDEVGVDVTEKLGITKYEPRIPSTMAGEMWNAFGSTLSYEIENIKKYPDVFEDGERVAFTEKIHGTWTCLGIDEGTPIVTSKGLSGRGLAFKLDEGVNDNVLYVQQWRKNADKVREVVRRLNDLRRLNVETVYVLGEIYGPGVQDMQYDLTEKHFRVFDIFIGKKDTGRYLSYIEMSVAVDGLFDTVPLLYYGAFSKDVVDFYTNAEDTSGKSAIAKHLREGIVIRPDEERRDDELGRVVLKSVSEKYLLRRNKNATDFQ